MATTTGVETNLPFVVPLSVLFSIVATYFTFGFDLDTNNAWLTTGIPDLLHRPSRSLRDDIDDTQIGRIDTPLPTRFDSALFAKDQESDVAHRQILLLKKDSITDEVSLCQVALGQLEWNSTSNYQELLSECSNRGVLLSFEDFAASTDVRSVITHKVPKTMDPNIPAAVFHRLKESCAHIPEVQQSRRPGYENACESIPNIASSSCRADAFFSGPLLSKEEVRCFHDATSGFLHAVAFREFHGWAEDALALVTRMTLRQQQRRMDEQSLDKRTVELPQVCAAVFKRISSCREGKGEFDFVKYTKPVLRMVLQRTTEKQPILVYDYRHSSFVHTTFREMLGLEPLPVPESWVSSRQTKRICPENILRVFHKCYDSLI